MGRHKIFDALKYVSYNEENDISVCLICGKTLKGKKTANIKRHYKLMHKTNLEEKDSDREVDEMNRSNVVKRKGNQIYLKLDKNEFLTCCIGLVTVKNIPFRIFDDTDYFKKLIKPYEDLYNLNINSKNIVQKVEQTSNKIKQVIAKTLNKRMISLKVEIATRMEKHILGINVQYVKDYKIRINTLGMIQLRKKHTREFLRQDIINCLRQFNIDVRQLYSSTTDNGANVLKVSKLLQELQDEMQVLSENHNDEQNSPDSDDEFEEIHTRLTSVLAVIRCAAHTIQLAAHDVIKTLKTNVEECRKAVKVLRAIIRGNEYQYNVQMPTIDNSTRWNSTFDMLNSLFKIKSFAEENEVKVPEVNWTFVINFIKAFKPLSECTRKFQSEQYVIGDFYRDWLCCEIELEEISKEANIYADRLITALTSRKEKILENEAFITAIYLDSRFNFLNTPFLNQGQKDIAIRHLLTTHDLMKQLAGEMSEKNVTDRMPSTQFQFLMKHFQSDDINRKEFEAKIGKFVIQRESSI